MTDKDYMCLALNLAQKGRGSVNPNPMVGAVVVKEGRIIGEGFHQKYGAYHAEREALNACRESPRGATLYVTLEPCCHYGKTPPCTQIIVEKEIQRVVIGSLDPNPLVSGKGVEFLQRQGIEVTIDVMQQECLKLNEVFFHFIRHQRPFVVMKYAMSTDGKIACASGMSRWITGEKAREQVHKDRGSYAAIMVGIGTVLADDPLLNCRIPNGRNPIRIICDSMLRLPLQSKIAQTSKEIPTILATCCMEKEKFASYNELGIDILQTPAQKGRVDLTFLMGALAHRQIDSVFLEGGGTMNWSALHSGIVNRVQTYIAPKILGGKQAKSPVSGEGVLSPDGAFTLTPPQITVLGNDILLESEVIYCSQGL